MLKEYGRSLIAKYQLYTQSLNLAITKYDRQKKDWGKLKKKHAQVQI